jgi:hypothetical protein
MVSIHILMRDSNLRLGGLSQWLKNFIAEDAIASMTHATNWTKINVCIFLFEKLCSFMQRHGCKVKERQGVCQAIKSKNFQVLMLGVWQ